MPRVLVFKLLKLQHVHKLQRGGMHRIDLVHLMTEKIEKGKWGHFELRPNKVKHKHKQANTITLKRKWTREQQ